MYRSHSLKALVICSVVIATGIAVPAMGACSPENNPATDNGDSTKMLNSVIAFIKKNHPEASSLIPDKVTWTKMDQMRRPGYTSETSSGSGWTITIGHAVTPELIFDVKAVNNGAGITWAGRIQNDIIHETGYQVK